MVDPYKKKLMDWELDGEVMPQSTGMERWFTGDSFNFLPTKTEMRNSGLETLLQGWTPDAPIIQPDTRVIALGSCFARYFVLWLAEHGFNQAMPESPYNALLRFGFGFESVAVIEQQFRWAFGGLDAKDAIWIDRDKRRFEATEERRALVRDALLNTDVLVMTLGLSEVWHDKTANEPLWRTMPENLYDPERHAFRVESMADSKAALESIHRIRAQWLPDLKIVFTISPVRLKGTFRPVSAFTANTVSKAILRAALDEFLRDHEPMLNQTYFYFPSYEMVMEIFREPFREDQRHLYDFAPKRILALFARHYTSYQHTEDDSLADAAYRQETNQDLHEVIAQLEQKVIELQSVCDERLKVIEELDAAAKERLEIIDRMKKP